MKKKNSFIPFTDEKMKQASSEKFDEISDMIGRFEAMRMLDEHLMEDENYTPDTIGADMYFVESFLTPDMEEDFPFIVRDFVKKGLSNFDPNHFLFYGNEYFEDLTFIESMTERYMSIMYSMAKSGDEYAVALFRYLYQTYHRKEYKVLKRFRSISCSEVMSIAEECKFKSEAMSRVLCMCPLMDISINKDCSILYIFLSQRFLEWQEEAEERISELYFKDGLFQRCKQQVEEWIGNTPLYSNAGDKLLKTYHEANELSHLILRYHGFSEDYLDRNMMSMDGLVFELAKCLAFLKTFDPKRDYSFDEVQKCAVLYTAITAICDQANDLNEYLSIALDLNQSILDEYDPLFNPDKINVTAKSKERFMEKSHILANEKASPDSSKALMKEINELRMKLHMEEQKAKHFKSSLDEQMKINTELSEMKDEMESMRQELIALREHVYQSSEHDSSLIQLSEDEMCRQIEDKRIVIIGGHSNWTSKLKNKFPNWIFLAPKPSGSVDGNVIVNADYVYFFTDFIKHSTYYKYVNIARDKGVPFGYIHSVNVAANVRQIYDETVNRL